MKSNTNLVWKYFLEQKAYEVILSLLWGVLVLTILWGVPMAIGLSMGDGYSVGCDDVLFGREVTECSPFETWFEGVFYLVIIGLISLGIYKWFESNWQDAIEKVEEEIKEQKRRRRNKR